VKVFVTGGTGLVGSHVIEQLLARGDQVLALVREGKTIRTESTERTERTERTGRTGRTGRTERTGAQVIHGSLSDGAIIEQAIEQCDAVVHAAAIILKGGGWDDFRVANVEPTERIARAAARFDRRLVHISSVAVYGRRTTYEGGPGSVSEDFGMSRPTWPGDHYGRSKREAEQAVWRVAEATKLRAVALRPCVIYGEGDRTFAIRVAQVVRRGIAPVIGRGDNTLSIVYAGNVAAAVLAALDRPAVTGPFNVANDGALSQRGFLEAFARGMNCRLRIVALPRGAAKAAAYGIDSLVRLVHRGPGMTTLKAAVQFLSSENPYVSDKARRELGWQPVLPPALAAERTGAWFAQKQQGHPQGAPLRQ